MKVKIIIIFIYRINGDLILNEQFDNKFGKILNVKFISEISSLFVRIIIHKK